MRDAGEGVGAKPAVQKPATHSAVSEVPVNGGGREQRANYVWPEENLENNGEQGNSSAPFIGAEIPQQPLHQAAVIRFA